MNNQLVPRYFLRASTAAPLYFLSNSTSTPPFRRISSSSGLQSILGSLDSTKLSSCVKSPETWSNLSRRVLIGTLTIFEQSLRISFNSRQLVGKIFLVTSFAPFFSYFFSTVSNEVFLPLFLEVSSFFSVDFFSSRGSVRLILSSLSSKKRQPSTPSRSTQETIFFISASPILDKQSLYLDFRPSTVRLIFFLSAIYSKLLLVMVLYEDNSNKSSRSYCNLQLGLLPETSTGGSEASTLTKKS